nr:MAG TPA: hypothetical protein [Caudoviricetes sp.]
MRPETHILTYIIPRFYRKHNSFFMVLYNHNILAGKILFNRNKTMPLCQLHLLSSSMVEQE